MIAGSTTLHLQERLDDDCLTSELSRQPGVTGVRGRNPIRFNFAPPGQGKAFDFTLRQERVGLSQGWRFQMSGEVRAKVADPNALTEELGAAARILRDAVSSACGAEVVPDGA